MKNQTNNKRGKSLPIIIITIPTALVVLFTIGTMISKFNNKKGWVNYLKNENIVVTMSEYNSQTAECKFNEVSISKKNLLKVLNKLSTKKITKYYYGDLPPTSTYCTNRIKINYADNTISLEPDGIIWVADENLIKKLDLAVDDVVHQINYKEEDFVYQIDANPSEIFNKYK